MTDRLKIKMQNRAKEILDLEKEADEQDTDGDSDELYEDVEGLGLEQEAIQKGLAV